MRLIQRSGSMPAPAQTVVGFSADNPISLADQINDFVGKRVVKIDSQSICASYGGVQALVVFSEQS